jgi:hypothetical protein
VDPRVLVAQATVTILEVRSISRKGLTLSQESSETLRQASEGSLLKMIKSDLHGDMQAVLRKGKTPQMRCKCALCNKMNGPKVAKFLVG